MSTVTGAQVIVAAANKSAQTSPQHLAPGSTELADVLTRLLRKYFALGVGYNREFFGTSAVVAHNGTGWPRPADAEHVYVIKDGATEVLVVPFDDLALDSNRSAVYEYGQVFRSVGGAADPPNQNLTFFYARQPQAVVDLTLPLDALWPDQWVPLLVCDLAAYLADKDQREADAVAFRAELQEWVQLYTQFLKHATAETRRFSRGWPHAATEAEAA